MNRKWAYLNDIIGCKIIALYTMNALIEIVYQKEGHTRSLTINFHTEGGALGYIETLYCDSIPLPPAKIIHPLSHAFESLYDYNLYVRENGWEHYEELELITDQGTFLLFFESDETQKVHAKMEKNRAPSLPLHVKQKAYLEALIKRINAHKIYPKAAQKGQIEGDVLVEFTISPKGELISCVILEGKNIFSKATEKAIYQSFPYTSDETLFTSNMTFQITLKYSLL